MESSPTPIIKQCAKIKKLTECQFELVNRFNFVI